LASGLCPNGLFCIVYHSTSGHQWLQSFLVVWRLWHLPILPLPRAWVKVLLMFAHCKSGKKEPAIPLPQPECWGVLKFPPSHN
jgi:hypothetical protein